jgi:hypothetical protein
LTAGLAPPVPEVVEGVVAFTPALEPGVAPAAGPPGDAEDPDPEVDAAFWEPPLHAARVRARATMEALTQAVQVGLAAKCLMNALPPMQAPARNA